MTKYLIILQLIVLSIISQALKAQNRSSLEDCINYALQHSTTINRANNSVAIQTINLDQSKANRGPNLMLSGNQRLSSNNNYLSTGEDGDWDRSTNNSLAVSLSSEITLYNGAKLKNIITQSETNLAASESDIQTQRELISVNILSAYINALMADENVKNLNSQLLSTEKQVELAQARKEAGIIAATDYLNIKSQYAADKATVTEAKNTYRSNLVTLMQLMNMPLNNSFNIQIPDIEALPQHTPETDASTIYNIALGLQPSIAAQEFYLESASMDVKIAKADALPQLSLSGGVGTDYSSSLNNVHLGEQLSNQVNPYVGLSFSVPIYQRKKVKNNIALAKIQIENEELELIDIKNDLRKYIEQACFDAQTAVSNFWALQEQYNAEKEAYDLSNEMFTQGMINSIDLLTSKNELSASENKLTQAKYNVILQNKIIDYYIGNSILF